MKALNTAASPHIRAHSSVSAVMLTVLLSLLPALLFGWLHFGPHALLVCACTTGTAVLTELLCGLVFRRLKDVTDGSAAVTGLLLGLMLPPSLPLWQAAAGAAAAILVFKQMFGGIGRNILNPALAARTVMMLCFSSDMTPWQTADSVSSATPLSGGDFTVPELLFGTTPGCIGETCAAALLLGGLFLCISRIISPIPPLSCLVSFAVCTWLLGENAAAGLLSGGLILAAVYCVSDYTTTPVTPRGKLCFGLCCGILAAVLRKYGPFPESAAISVLLMNVLTPLIDRITRTKPFGLGIPLPQQDK